MPGPTIVTDQHLTVTEFPTATVQIKNRLEDEDWITPTFLFCDSLTLNANAYDEAELRRYTGDMIQPGDDAFGSYGPESILGKFVKLTIACPLPQSPIEWVGYIVGTTNKREAVVGDDPALHELSGKDQVLSAVGLEYFLDRVQIDSSYIFKELPGSPEPEDLNYTKIQRVIAFNGGKGIGFDGDSDTRANRCDEVNTDNVFTFVPADQEGELWSLKDIVKYLLKYYTAKNKAGDFAPMEYELGSVEDASGILDAIAPTINPENMTVMQVLNRILSPQRGYVWWCEFQEPIPGVRSANIRVETLNNANITLPSTGTLPANSDQQTLDFDQELDVTAVELTEPGSRQYHQVIVRGSRMTSTVSLGVRTIEGEGDDPDVRELIEDWTPGQESEQLQAAAETTGYDALTEAEQKKRNDAFRQSEKFAPVFCQFRVSPEWDGKSGDGGKSSDPEEEHPRNWSFPVLSPTGSITGTLEFAVNGLRVLNHTRLKRGWNYTNTAAITREKLDESVGEYVAMFGLLRVATGDYGADPPTADKYQFVEKMGDNDFAEGTKVSDKISMSYSLRVQQNVPGIMLNAAGVNHACALNHWEGATPTGTEPQVDYETLRLTCTIEADTYCEARYPANDDLPADIPIERLLIDAGDEYRLDFLAANTVLDIENGEPVLTNGGVLRDDRKRLNDIARIAYEWYRVDRRPIEFGLRQIQNIWRLGTMITTIGSGSTQQEVNTVITQIKYDLVNGLTGIKTNDDNFDVSKVA